LWLLGAKRAAQQNPCPPSRHALSPRKIKLRWEREWVRGDIGGPWMKEREHWSRAEELAGVLVGEKGAQEEAGTSSGFQGTRND